MNNIDHTPSLALQYSYCVPPGETLLEVIESLDISQKELSLRTGISVHTINRIIKGSAPISSETAEKLAYITHMPAKFWTNLEQNYRDAQKQQKIQEDTDKEKAKMFLSGFPYADLTGLGLCENTRNYSLRRESLLKFFGVAGEDEFHRTYIEMIKGAARVGFSKTWSAKAFSAWLRVGELSASSIKTCPFSIEALKKSIIEIRKLVSDKPSAVWGKVQELLSGAGVAAVLVPEFKGVHVYGYSRFIKSDKAIVQLSLRGGRVGTFWFNLFHELAHLLKHGKKKVFINIDSVDKGKLTVAQMDPDENAADRYSRDLLIPQTSWNHFVAVCNYPNAAMMTQFARQMNVSVDVVLGRLQLEGRVPYNRFPKQTERLIDMPILYPRPLI